MIPPYFLLSISVKFKSCFRAQNSSKRFYSKPPDKSLVISPCVLFDKKVPAWALSQNGSSDTYLHVQLSALQGQLISTQPLMSLSPMVINYVSCVQSNLGTAVCLCYCFHLFTHPSEKKKPNKDKFVWIFSLVKLSLHKLNCLFLLLKALGCFIL